MSRKFFVITLLILIGVSFASPHHNNYEADHFKGIWEGVLKVSGTELRVVFKISEETCKTFTATMDSPDQGVKDIPVSEVKIEGGNLTLEVKVIYGIYEGKLNDEGNIIVGEWRQSGLTLPLILKKVKKAPEIRRPQEPERPYPYDEEEVSYENNKAGIKLAGSLTLPRVESPFPAVLLISGSGEQDRNETVFGHRPFLVLSDYLSRRGIAVLRTDDRVVGGSTGNILEATSEDFASDVIAGINYLKTRKEINIEKIGLIGHSEGGIIAPMVAVESEDIAFIVLLAGTGLTGEEILYLQGALISRVAGCSEEEIVKNRTLQERLFTVLKEEEDNKAMEDKICKIMEDALLEISEEEKEAMGYSEERNELQIKLMLSPWFRFFLTYNPKHALMKVKCPVLAIIGEKDLQVPPKENLSAIEEALRTGGNEDYLVKELPGHNHLFQTAETGLISEYGKIEETISPDALKLIGDWILDKVESP